MSELNTVIKGISQGFGIAFGVALANWAIKFVPLSGFNLSF